MLILIFLVALLYLLILLVRQKSRQKRFKSFMSRIPEGTEFIEYENAFEVKRYALKTSLGYLGRKYGSYYFESTEDKGVIFESKEAAVEAYFIALRNYNETLSGIFKKVEKEVIPIVEVKVEDKPEEPLVITIENKTETVDEV